MHAMVMFNLERPFTRSFRMKCFFASSLFLITTEITHQKNHKKEEKAAFDRGHVLNFLGCLNYVVREKKQKEAEQNC